MRVLTKTQVLTGMNCPRALYLSVHHPGLAVATESLALVHGLEIGEFARASYPGGVLVERTGTTDPIETTRQLLQDPTVNVLFEAGFVSDQLKIFVDVLQREDPGWVVTEVKSGTSVKDRHIQDLAIQALALQQCGLPVHRFELMHVESGFLYLGDGNYDDLFTIEDCTQEVLARVDEVPGSVNELETMLDAEEPQVYMDGHCRNPYPCSFMEYCRSLDARYPVSSLPNGYRVAPRLRARGIHDIRDIPEGELDSERHEWVRRVTIAGREELLPGAAGILRDLAYPRYYLDFESMQFPIPRWKDSHPYEQVPFQWSCHVEDESGQLAHHEFLDVSGDDPRLGFAQSLVASCGDKGPVIVYNASFEKRILRELAERFEDMRDPLMAISDRIFDLLPVTRRYYYHPDMKGSWSIKSVLPCLVPGLDYQKLGDVRDGLGAQKAYLDLIANDMPGDVARQLEEGLRDYCAMDTLAMVKIVERILEQKE